MQGPILHNINICSVTLLPSPRVIHQALPHTPATQQTVLRARETVERILDGEDRRLLMIVGPCSVHDIEAVSDYARRLAGLARALEDQLYIVMRVYFEKPRSAMGWKGFINDPFLDDTFRMDEGLRQARRLLLSLAEMGLPAATEALDTLTPQYLGDLIAWTGIGARTAESQPHREMASGLSTPVGFKNPPDGTITGAVNAIRTALRPHHFLGTTDQGLPAVFGTTGNPYPHIVLRGGSQPNYDEASVSRCEKMLSEAGLPLRILLDCSHGNSQRNPDNQALVLRSGLEQIAGGNQSLFGFMLESHLEKGAQPMPRDGQTLRYGVSITDPCIDWPTTDALLREAAGRYQR